MQPGIVDLHDVCVRMALHEHLIARLVAVPHTIGVVHIPGAKRVLKAAAMTYVASFAVSAANLLRLLLLTNNKRR